MWASYASLFVNFDILLKKLRLAPKQHAIHPIFLRYVCGRPKIPTLGIQVVQGTKQQKVTK